MKLTIIEHYPTNSRGGSEKAFYEVLIALKKFGHHIELFYSNYGNLIPIYEEQSINCFKIPEFNLEYFSLKNWKSFLKAAEMIAKSKPDIIYINQLADAPLAVFSKLFYKKTKIVCHLRVPKIGSSRIFNYCGKYIDTFITLNKLIKTQFSTLFNSDKIIIINDGIVIPPNINFVKKENQNKAVYLGRISPEKGIMELLTTWSILVNHYKLKIPLSITGPARSSEEIIFKKELENQIENLKLSEIVTINTPIENPIEYLGLYDFSVLPSIWPEPFGRTIPESILAGTPVFARKVGIVEDILAPAKDFIYETEEELAEKIVLFYENKLPLNLERLQQHIINHYDIAKNVIQIEQTLLSTIEK